MHDPLKRVVFHDVIDHRREGLDGQVDVQSSGRESPSLGLLKQRLEDRDAVTPERLRPRTVPSAATEPFPLQSIPEQASISDRRVGRPKAVPLSPPKRRSPVKVRSHASRGLSDRDVPPLRRQALHSTAVDVNAQINEVTSDGVGQSLSIERDRSPVSTIVFLIPISF